MGSMVFFFSGFKLSSWWFELWNTLRKSFFTIGNVIFAPAGVKMQTWAALMLLLLYVVVFTLALPYEEPYLDRLEIQALSINVVTLLLGIGLFTNEESGEAKSDVFAMIMTTAIIILNALFVLNVVRVLGQNSQYCHKCKTKKEATEQDAEDTTEVLEDRNKTSKTTEIKLNALEAQQRKQQVTMKIKMLSRIARVKEENDRLRAINNTQVVPLRTSAGLHQTQSSIRAVERIKRQSEASRQHSINQTLIRKKSANARVKQRLELRKRVKQAGALSENDIFGLLSKEQQHRLIDVMKYKKYPPNHVLCKEGDVATGQMYLLVSGTCSVSVTTKGV